LKGETNQDNTWTDFEYLVCFTVSYRSFPYSCSTLRRKIATLCDSFTIKAPFLVDLKKPELKIPHTVNFYIKVEPRAQFLAAGWEDARGRAVAALKQPSMTATQLLFIFVAVQNTRFGDSTGKPTEDGLTADAVCVYEWTEARNGTTPVCLWGHSLGTGVATNAAKVLEEKGFPVDAIILEAPFTNIWVASINYPVLKEKKVSREFKEVAEWFYTASQIYRKHPGFLSTVMDALRKDELVFPSDENLNLEEEKSQCIFLELNAFLPLVPSVKFLSSPLLIIHGEDDETVPLEFGKKVN
ncbi:hypothetical protein E2I00_016455, partial [Balaenoptera physalus]